MTSQPPRVLLVEDDPVSRAFLGTALRALPATVDAADSVAAALALGAAGGYDLWLFDANLPDGSGAELLAQLRARDAATPAVAHTAANDPAVVEALLAAGFRQVLVKPLPAATLQRSAREVLGLTVDGAAVSNAWANAVLPDWDDEGATRALNGNREHIDALRRLFVGELPAVIERVRNAFRNEDFQGLHGELHRLRASCGFVGATRLHLAVQALGEDQRSHARLHDFTLAAQALTASARPTVA
jgi:CheY-like chemotaxis protein/HPt (histidine-containing phosphotransfer) domain-containing protein